MENKKQIEYPFMDGTGKLSYDLSGFGEVDARKYCLFETLGDKRIDKLNFEDRANLMQSFCNDLYNQRFSMHVRYSHSGCGTEKDVMCPFTGRIKKMLNFASNDYLNMSQHPEVINAAKEALDRYGAGAGASCITSGSVDVMKELEKEIAATFKTEDAMVFPSGYATNIGVLGGMLRGNDVAIIDMYSHASIIDGGMQTNALFFVHNDVRSLETQLKKADKMYANKIVAVDAVYSMDGDIAPLPEILELCRKYNAWLMVDDAHGFGVLGKNGCGVAEHFGLEGKIDLMVGTLSKAIGTVGGFVAAKKPIINYLRFASRSHFFTTAPFISANAAALASIRIIKEDAARRQKLWDNIAHFKNRFTTAGMNILDTSSSIFPVIMGDSNKALEAAYRLHEADILVNPVPYPAVPRKLARVRMSISAGFDFSQLDKGAEEMIRIAADLDITGKKVKDSSIV